MHSTIWAYKTRYRYFHSNKLPTDSSTGDSWMRFPHYIDSMTVDEFYVYEEERKAFLLSVSQDNSGKDDEW